VATRSHTTFKKRQKELARVEKQRDKVAKRSQRKIEKETNPGAEDVFDENAVLTGPQIYDDFDDEPGDADSPSNRV